MTFAWYSRIVYQQDGGGGWFDVPTGGATAVITPPTVEDETGWEDIPTPEPVAPTQITPEVQQRMDTVIATAPEPDKMRELADAAIGLHQGLGVPFGAAFEQARAFADSPNPEQKKLGQAVADEWKLAYMGQQRGDLGIKLRATVDPVERVKLEQQIKDLAAKMPAPDETRRNFLQRMLLGGTNLVGQQVAGLASTGRQVVEGSVGRGLGTLYQFTKNALTFQWRKQAKLIAGVPAEAAKMTGIGRAEGGNAYLDMLDAGVPHEIAGPLSDTVAVFNTGIEFLSDATMVKLFGPLKASAAGILKTVGQKLGWDGAMTQLGLRLAAKWAAGAATNLGEEFTQETITFLAEEAAKAEAEERGLPVADTDSWKRRMEGVAEAIPGFLAMGLLPGITEGVRSLAQTTKATAKPAAAAPAAEPAAPPMAEVRAEIEAAPTPEAKVAAIATAETAKLAEISRAEVLSAGMVADAVELAEMREAAEAETSVTAEPVEAAPAATPPRWATPETAYPVAGGAETVGGMTVLPDIPNTSSIESSLDEYTVLKGVRKMPMDDFGPYARPYSVEESKREDALVEQIKASGEIKPLIVAIDAEGPYILEGGHRFGALQRLGVTEFPALVVIDKTAPTAAPVEAGGGGPTVEAGAQATPGTAQVRPPEAIRADVQAGEWVSDLELGAVQTTPWGAEEATTRDAIRNVARGVAAAGGTFDTFVAETEELAVYAKETGKVTRSAFTKSPDYLQQIWDATKKPEAVLTETGEADETATIDAREEGQIEYEEQGLKRYKVDDETAALAQLAPDAWNPDNETVGKIADEWATVGKEGADPETESLIRQKAALVSKMTQGLLKKPTAGLGQVAINELRALQAPYTARETKAIEKAKKAIETFRAAHPGAALPADAQEVLDRRSLRDLTVAELRGLYEQAMEIRKRGAATERARLQTKKARRVQMASDLLGDIPGGVTVERLAEYASIETQGKVQGLRLKGKLKSNIMHPLRIFKSLGATFEKVFWDTRKTLEGKEAERLAALDREYKELLTKTKVKPAELLRIAKGTGYWVDDLLYYYGQMKDDKGRKAVLYGNDENEQRLTQAIAGLPQNYRDFMDGLLELNNKHYGEVAKVQIEENGTAAPQVRFYLPLKRMSMTGGTFAGDLSTDTAMRTDAATLQKGFINERLNVREGVQQKRIRTDLLNIILESMHQESKYVAMEGWARDMGWLLGGRSKESKLFIEAVTQKHGEPMVRFLKDYVKAVVQPESFNGQHFSGLISRVFRNLNDAVLMFKIGTAAIQVEGPFRYLSRLKITQWHHLIGGLWKATLQPNKTLEAMFQKSPVMREMVGGGAIDPALSEGRGFKHARSEIGLNLQMARKALKTGGYAMLQAMNRWTIASGWTAVYQAEFKRTGNEATAIKAADDATFLTQPSGKLADAPRMYWTSKGNPILAYLQRFSRASNQMAQMMTFDLYAALKKGQIDKVVGIAMSFAIGAFLNSLRRRKRFPKDEKELMEDGVLGLVDTLGAMTYGAAPAVAAGAGVAWAFATKIEPLEAAERAGGVIKDVLTGDISEKDVWRLVNLLAQMQGIPTPAAENLVRSAYDFDDGEWRIDPLELFGRKPRGE